MAISVSAARLEQQTVHAQLHRIRASASFTAFTNALAVSLFSLIPIDSWDWPEPDQITPTGRPQLTLSGKKVRKARRTPAVGISRTTSWRDSVWRDDMVYCLLRSDPPA